ncbi:MAG TPA: response regulator transcription factor [Stellaceae bacterium]|nr:response regulator transcription factor [Stellaceae bacterium]
MEAAGRRILLIDGDPVSRQALAEQLAPACGVPIVADSAKQGLAALAEAACDLAILAPPLHDTAVEDSLRMLRAAAPLVPILLLTGTDLLAIDGGAPQPDEILTRPVRLNLLLERVEALAARRAGGRQAIGPYRFRPAEKLLIDPDGEREIRLTEKEVAILDYLLQAGDRTITRELLLNEVWGYNSGVTTHTLETHVYRLRRKIEADPGRAEILISEAGGYRLALGGVPGE